MINDENYSPLPSFCMEENLKKYGDVSNTYFYSCISDSEGNVALISQKVQPFPESESVVNR